MEKNRTSPGRIFSFLLAVIVLLTILPSVPTPAADTIVWTRGKTEKDSRGYQVNGKNYDLIKGVLQFPCTVGPDSATVFYYSDGFFANDPYVYHPELATISAMLAYSAFHSNEGDYPEKNKNIEQFLRDIGCKSENIFSNAFMKQKPETDSIGCAMGMKELSGSDGRILIAIGIRGGNYGKEWASNVTLGKDYELNGEAKGFATAASIVFKDLRNFIVNHKLQKKIKEGKVTFWISGFSRAGATTNLTAKRIIDAFAKDKNAGNKVFAYCLEAPKGGVEILNSSGSDYSCIHSIINTGDIVPYVAPSQMGFRRYGVDHFVPGTAAGTASGSSDNKALEVGSYDYSVTKKGMLGQLAIINPGRKFSDAFTLKGLDLSDLKKIFDKLDNAKWYNAIGEVFDSVRDGVALARKFVEKGIEAILKPGDPMTMESFEGEFIDKLTEYTGISRNNYSGGTGASYGNVEAALRDYVAIVQDSSGKEKAEFKNRVMGLYKGGVVGIKDLAGFFFGAFNNWDNPKLSASERTMIKNTVVGWLEKSKCFDALNLTPAEKERVLKVDLPVILDFVLTYAAKDYHANLHHTDGSTQIFTMWGNMENILVNHNSDVVLAWLRTDDPLYKGETKQYSVVDPQLSAPKVRLGKTELKEGTAVNTVVPKSLLAKDGAIEIDVTEVQSYYGTLPYQMSVTYQITDLETNETKRFSSQNCLTKIIKLPSNVDGKRYQLRVWVVSKDKLGDFSSYLFQVKNPAKSLTISRIKDGKPVVEKQVFQPSTTIKLQTEIPKGSVFDHWKLVYTAKNGTQTSKVVRKNPVNLRPGDNIASLEAKAVFVSKGSDTTVKTKTTKKGAALSEAEQDMTEAESTANPEAVSEEAQAAAEPVKEDSAEIVPADPEEKSETFEEVSEAAAGALSEEKQAEAENTANVEAVTEAAEDGSEAAADALSEAEQDMTEAESTENEEAVTLEEQIEAAPAKEDPEEMPAADLEEMIEVQEDASAEAAADLEPGDASAEAPVVQKIDFTIDLPEDGELDTTVNSCAVTYTDGAVVSIPEEQLGGFAVEWNPLPDEEGEERFEVLIYPQKDSEVSKLPIEEDVLVTVNGVEGTAGFYAEAEEGYDATFMAAELSMKDEEEGEEVEEPLVVSYFVYPSDIVAEHGADVSSLLPQSIFAQLSNGETAEMPVTWSLEDAVWYIYDDTSEEPDWVQLDHVPDPSTPDQVFCAIVGDIQIPEGIGLSDEVDSNATISVYIGGIPDQPAPTSSLYEGGYVGPQEVRLSEDDPDAEIYYTLDGTDPRTSSTRILYTGPFMIGEGIEEPTEYLIIAYRKGDQVTTDDSDVVIFPYVIFPESIDAPAGEGDGTTPEIKKPDAGKPATGDQSHVLYWIIGMSAAVLVVAVTCIVMVVKKRKKKE